MSFGSFVAQNSDTIFDFFKNIVNAPHTAGDFISQGLHLDKLPGALKQILDTNPTNAANKIVDNLDKWANPQFHQPGWLHKTGDASHTQMITQLKDNLGGIARFGGVALPTFLTERLAAWGIRKGVKKSVGQFTDKVTDAAATKATEQVVSNLNLISAANGPTISAKLKQLLGMSYKMPNSVDNAYTAAMPKGNLSV